MGRQLTVSDMGLKLIKAYEGYRPVDRTLVTGQRVVGYGHRPLGEDSMVLDQSEAEALLKSDLAPFEDMINENVHAPLSQSQFDALCSFAYNIGPKAFLRSDTLRALNNGRILDAANGFDIWRKSEIDGKTYVVDALMRRRTAEKALFLRPAGRPVKASGVDLPPIEDETVALLSTEDALPVFTRDDRAGVVSVAPYDVAPVQSRRREDGPAGILTLSEVFDDEDGFETELDIADEALPFVPDDVDETTLDKPVPSPIAVAAEGLSDRLDALIDDVRETSPRADDVADWPEALIKAETVPETDIGIEENVVPFKARKDDEDGKVDLVIDNLREDDAMREHELLDHDKDGASSYIETEADSAYESTGSSLPYWLMIIFGSVLLGASFAARLKGSEQLLGEYGPMLTILGIFIGAMMFIGALYYALRHSLRR